ncbi:MAG TPA: hypothetical protein VER58_21790 [Thermoanaerobaculia bacterium]|nr:hypothetical protein [Thermoanaerobaculia bacterium]
MGDDKLNSLDGDFGDRFTEIRRTPNGKGDDYATQVYRLPPTIEVATELVSPEQIRNDALARVEGKLDAVIEALIVLQRRVESIDAVFAQVVARHLLR